jgi:hypothetical protein
MAQQQYLSTDPNAGEQEPQYLSTDPNAGQEAPQEEGMGKKIMRFLGGEPMTPEQHAGITAAAREMGTKNPIREGVEQGIGVAIAGPLNRVVSSGAQRLYQGLLKPSKALRAEYPDAVRTLVNERVPISQGGLRKVEGLMSRSSKQADGLITQNANAEPIRAREVVSQFGDTVKNLRKRIDIGQPSELAKVGDRGRRLMQADRGIGIEVPRAQELKRTAQDAASAGYRQARAGTVKEVSADTMLDKDVARGFRAAIERRIPEIATINRRTQSLGGAKDAVEDALGREANNLAVGGMRDLIAAGAGGGIGAAVGMPAQGATVGLLMRLLTTPSVGSRVAIAANDAAKMGIPANLLRALMASHQTEQTEP